MWWTENLHMKDSVTFMIFSGWAHMTAVWLRINSCREERLLVLRGGSHGWFWQIHLHSCRNHQGVLTASIFSVDNSALRTLVLIIHFHLIFQDEIIHINDTWYGTNDKGKYIYAKRWQVIKIIYTEVGFNNYSASGSSNTTTSALGIG